MPNFDDRLSVFSVFMDCKNSLRNMVNKYLTHKSDVEDVLQETFTRTFAASQKNTIDYPKLYLFKTAKNLVQRENTKLATKLTEYLDDSIYQNLATEERLPQEIVNSAKESLLLQEALASLPKQCQRVTIMRVQHDIAVKDIAAILGLSVSTTEKHLAKGFERCDDYVSKLIDTTASTPESNAEQAKQSNL